jgi:hypothetical protein
MVLINIRDNVGPYPADQTDKMFMIVIRVWFSEFVASSAVKDTEWKSTAIPRLQSADSKLSSEAILTESSNIEKMIIVPYSCNENDLGERPIKGVIRHLWNSVCHKTVYHDWVLNLPLVQRIMNSEVHHSTGVSPTPIMFGYNKRNSTSSYEIHPSILRRSHRRLVQYTRAVQGLHIESMTLELDGKMLANQGHLIRIGVADTRS